MRNDNIRERQVSCLKRPCERSIARLKENIAERCRKARLRWYGHVKRRDREYVGRKALEMVPPGRGGRPKQRWTDCVNRDMRATGQQKTVGQKKMPRGELCLSQRPHNEVGGLEEEEEHVMALSVLSRFRATFFIATSCILLRERLKILRSLNDQQSGNHKDKNHVNDSQKCRAKIFHQTYHVTKLVFDLSLLFLMIHCN